jgi:hypothetical protein
VPVHHCERQVGFRLCPFTGPALPCTPTGLRPAASGQAGALLCQDIVGLPILSTTLKCLLNLPQQMALTIRAFTAGHNCQHCAALGPLCTAQCAVCIVCAQCEFCAQVTGQFLSFPAYFAANFAPSGTLRTLSYHPLGVIWSTSHLPRGGLRKTQSQTQTQTIPPPGNSFLCGECSEYA